MATRAKIRDRFFDKTSQLPAQVSLRHITAISICSVVGTGVFISTLSNSLWEAGPAGVLIAYALTSSIVYCTAVSNGEMMAHLPSVGGPVGLADVFVDPALGFAMGWNAWYHWSIIIPTQLSQAGRLAKSYISTQVTPGSTSLYYGSIAFFLVLAVGVNLTGAKRFGQIHVFFAVLKMFTLAGVVIIALLIDWSPVPLCNAFPAAANCPNSTLLPSVGATCSAVSADLLAGSDVRILGKYWHCPGPWVQPFGTSGTWGSIAGVFTVLIQAAFSFFGTEIAGVPGREIKDASRNIPRAIRRVWLRITVLYTLAVIAAGLVVPSNHPYLKSTNTKFNVLGSTSPWLIALYTASPATKLPQYILSAIFMLSAFSAASADIFVSSRYLFFLARRGHAPWWFGSLYKSKQKAVLPFRATDLDRIEMLERHKTPLLTAHGSPPSPVRPLQTHSRNTSFSTTLSPASPSSVTSELGLLLPHGHSRQFSNSFSPPAHARPTTPQSASSRTVTISAEPTPSRPQTAQTSALRPLMAQGAQSGPTLTLRTSAALQPSQSAPASLHSPGMLGGPPRRLRRAASLVGAAPPEVVVPWVGVLFAGVIGLLVFMAPAGLDNVAINNAFKFLTQMTNCAALVSWVGILVTYLRFYDGTQYWEKKDDSFRAAYAETLYKNRTWGQPWLARYALAWCIIILLGQGWSSFTSPGVKRIAVLTTDLPVHDNPDIGDFAFAFIVSYLPVAAFLLLAFGYKLVYQTKFVPLEDMKFGQRERRGSRPLPPLPTDDGPPRNFWDRMVRVLL